VNRVAIIETGISNVDSITRAIEECGGEVIVTRDPHDLEDVSRIVLPGVGSFPKAMQMLHETGVGDALQEQVVGQGIPFLGICLGMQVMAARGWEGGEAAGLGWIPGDVRLLQPAPGERVPHVGWNTIQVEKESALFDADAQGHDYYFVHSYALVADDRETVTASCDFAGGFPAAVQRDQIFGVQFHPEKSQRAGFEVLRHFLSV
jgi:glutamine amidotransferase